MKLITLSTLLILLSLPVFPTDKVYTLKNVMQGLGDSMDELNRGIFYEDFKIIQEAALKVANHPKPKTQLPIVVRTLNIRMPKFKDFDSMVHNSATDIIGFAKKKDMDGILKKHKVIMNNCVACHAQFRSELSNALLR